MKKLFLHMLFITTVFILLLSCNHGDSSNVKISPFQNKNSAIDDAETNTGEIRQYEANHGIYEISLLELPDRQMQWLVQTYNHQYLYQDQIRFLSMVVSDTEIETYQIFYDKNGTYIGKNDINLKRQKIQNQNSDYDIRGSEIGEYLYLLQDGKQLTCQVFESDQQIIFYLLNASDVIIDKSEPLPFAKTANATNHPVVIPVDEDCFVYYDIYDSHNFYLIDSTLAVYGPFSTASALSGGYRDGDGTVVLYCDNNAAHRFDPTTKQVTPVVLYKETEAYRQADTVLYAENTVYLIGRDGIVVQRGDAHEESLLVDWKLSYLDRGNLQFYGVLPEDTFLVCYKDPLTYEEVPAILKSAGEVQVPVREVVRVASIGDYNNPGQTFLREAILSFNRENPDYIVELISYEEIAAKGNVSADFGDIKQTNQTFLIDMMSGSTAYDLLVLGGYHGRELQTQLSEKGLFYDLSSLFDGEFIGGADIMECVRFMTEGGTVEGLPLALRISTLLTTTDTLAADVPLTMDVIYQMAEALEEDEVLFSDENGYQSILPMLRATAQSEFLDMEQKISAFDSDAYIAFLTFLSQMQTGQQTGEGKLIDKENGYFHIADGMHYGISMGGDPIAALCGGTVKFANLTLSSVNDVRCMLYFLRQIPNLRLCGYPSSIGGCLYAESELNVSMLKDAANPGGAAAFLSFLYSDTVQTSAALQDGYGIPVTKSALAKCIDFGYYYFEKCSNSLSMYDSMGNLIESLHSVLCREVTKNKLPLLLRANLEEYYVKKEEVQSLISYISKTPMCGIADTTIAQIIDEELSEASSGVRSIEEAAQFIQRRVFLYINE